MSQDRSIKQRHRNITQSQTKEMTALTGSFPLCDCILATEHELTTVFPGTLQQLSKDTVFCRSLSTRLTAVLETFSSLL